MRLLEFFNICLGPKTTTHRIPSVTTFAKLAAFLLIGPGVPLALLAAGPDNQPCCHWEMTVIRQGGSS
jgi:hypothetical protein